MGKKLKRGFYWRGGLIWVRTDPLTGKPASTRCHDQAAAELWRAQRERHAADPRHAAAQTATVGEWVMRTIKAKQAGRTEGTANMYSVKLGHVVRLFGADAVLSTITPGAVDEYITQRRTEGVKNNTIQRELTCLRQMLRLAKRAGAYALDLDDVMPVGFSAGYKPTKRILRDRAELELLLGSLRTDEERAWVCFALAFAADAGDVERARPEDFDRARNVVRIRGTKTTSRDAEVPILPLFAAEAAYALERLPVSWTRASKGLGEACRRAGLPHLSPKDLRRTAASWLITSGADQDLVSRFLRHKSSLMVRTVYGQIQPETLGALLADQVQKRYSSNGPLGGKADAEDLKGDPRTLEKSPASIIAAESAVLPDREQPRISASVSTETLHVADPFVGFVLGAVLARFPEEARRVG